MKCRNCDHETYLLVCERCLEATSSNSRVTHCGRCNAINTAAYAFCASCGAKRPAARKPIVHAAPQDPPADLCSRRCHQTIARGIDVCPFCASDCRPVEERMLTAFGQFSVAAAFFLLFAVPVYVYFLSGNAMDQRDHAITAKFAAPFDAAPVAPVREVASQPPASSLASANETAEAQVAQTISEWIASFQSRNLEQHVGYYGPRLSTYFTWHDVSHKTVAKDKQRFFSDYSTIAMLRIRDLNIQQLAPDQAVATFLKDWSVSGRGDFSGTVLQRLRLERHGQKWLISSEEELRTLKRHKTSNGGVRLASFPRG